MESTKKYQYEIRGVKIDSKTTNKKYEEPVKASTSTSTRRSKGQVRGTNSSKSKIRNVQHWRGVKIRDFTIASCGVIE